jgi:hypothetical protein
LKTKCAGKLCISNGKKSQDKKGYVLELSEALF